MKSWSQIVTAYRDPRILSIFLLGFSSGLPFLLTLGTLHAWLTEAGVSKTTIGIFALATAPYAFKFLWAPIIDHVALPYLSARLGQRRSWMLVSQIALIGSLVALGTTDPALHIGSTAFYTFLVAMCAATQDNVVEAYRVEALSEGETGIGASASVFGFRLGMWVSGGVALYLAAVFNWFTVYTMMAGCVSIGIMATLAAPELPLSRTTNFKTGSNILKNQSLLGQIKYKFHRDLWPSLSSFFQRRDLLVIIAFIIFYKVGDSVLNQMSIRFLLEIGFTTIEIAHVAKSFGIFAMIVGGVISGILLMRMNIAINLVLCCILMVISCIMFMVQAYFGHALGLLILTMGLENLACGMGATTLIAYFSGLCQLPNTATHFAILSSCSSLARVMLSILAGWLADQMDWVSFYAIVAFASLPCLVILACSRGDNSVFKLSKTGCSAAW